MGVDYFSCANCHEATSEYDRIHCDKCEVALCSCSMPNEIKKTFNIYYWDQIWSFLSIGDDGNLCKDKRNKDQITDEQLEIFKKYLTANDDYGIVLKEEYCPICQKENKYKDDPEYKEYLRLKAKFEK